MIGTDKMQVATGLPTAKSAHQQQQQSDQEAGHRQHTTEKSIPSLQWHTGLTLASADRRCFVMALSENILSKADTLGSPRLLRRARGRSKRAMWDNRSGLVWALLLVSLSAQVCLRPLQNARPRAAAPSQYQQLAYHVRRKERDACKDTALFRR